MKTFKFLIIAILFFTNGLQAQIPYLFDNPEGYGRNATGGGTPTASNIIVVTSAVELSNAIIGDKSVIVVKGEISTGRIKGVVKNKTILGLPGSKLINLDQTNAGSGILHLQAGSDNVIIRNLTFEGPGAFDEDGWDLITNKGCGNLWVDHCEFQDGMDCLFDNTNGSSGTDNITISWCKFTFLKAPKSGGSGGSDDHRFANLVGGGESDFPSDGHFSITWQNCWWDDGVVARMVRGRNVELHMLNCYWGSSNAKWNISLTKGEKGSYCYVESGVFETNADSHDDGNSGINITYDDCVGNISNQGSASKPSYSYTEIPVDQVKSAITNADCGAGATLVITESGSIAVSCGTQMYTLSVNQVSNGSISPTTNEYPEGTIVTLTATSEVGYYFKNWTGALTSSESSTTITMDSDKSISAVFEQALEYSVAVSINGTGEVSPDINGSYFQGTALYTQAIEYIGYRFNGWTGDISSSEKELRFTVSGKTNVTANFISSDQVASYEFEDGNYEAGIAVFETNKNPGYSGSGYVNTENITGTWTEITVYAPEGGEYTTSMTYAGSSDRPMTISVNSIGAIPVNGTSTGAFTTWGTETVIIPLVEGKNTLRFTATGSSGAPNLDKLEIMPNKNAPVSITLTKGWNLIGCSLEGSTAIEDALSSIWSNIEVVKDMENFYSVSQPDIFNMLRNLNWGYGYLIKVSEDCELQW